MRHVIANAFLYLESAHFLLKVSSNARGHNYYNNQNKVHFKLIPNRDQTKETILIYSYIHIFIITTKRNHILN